MAHNKEQAIKDARQFSGQIYDKYKSSGVLAIYLWGSVTRGDFDPETSDIDLICIVDDKFPLELNETIREQLTNLAPDYEWGFQIIYADELNGGPLRSRLAQAMSPQTILPSFTQWTYLWGKQYIRNDFSVEDASFDERMCINIEEIRRRLGNLPNGDDYRQKRDRKGAVKACLQLIYNRQLKRGSEHFDLDYNVLPDKADDLEKPILDKLLEVKNNQIYLPDEFADCEQKMKDFATVIEQELNPLSYPRL